MTAEFVTSVRPRPRMESGLRLFAIWAVLTSVDFVLVLGAGWAAHAWREQEWGLGADYQIALAFTALIILVRRPVLNPSYLSPLPSAGRVLGRVLRLWASIAVGLVVIGAALKVSGTFSRLWLAMWLAIGCSAHCLVVLMLRGWLRGLARRGLLSNAVAVVGEPALCGTVSRDLQADAQYALTAVVHDRLPDGGLVPADQILARLRVLGVDRVLLALPWSDVDRLWELRRTLSVLPVDLQLAPALPLAPLAAASFELISGTAVFGLVSRPLSPMKLMVKRVEDIAVAALVLLLLAPLLLLIALAIRLDSPGPVLFRQPRRGFNGDSFTILKFRTMRVGADEPQVPQAKRCDPRVTRVGIFLRRASLDELPQFLNVLQGSMSVVGPRPHALPHDDYYGREIGEYISRHKIKPGITGWAQVNGYRGETNTVDKMRRRVEYDLAYIEHWSPLLDLKILLLTPIAVLWGENAY